MRVAFLCPHTKISGGVKVIFRLANGLKNKGVQVCVVPRRFNDRTLFWYGPAAPTFKIIEDQSPSYHTLPECDVVINYADGDPYIPLKKTTKQVLFLQGFGQDSTEKFNLLYPYDGVIATSSWLATTALNCGQRKIYIVPPGIDESFVPIDVEKSKIPIIGTLHHHMPIKNVSLFEETIKHLYYEKNTPVKPLFLSSKPVANIDGFVQGNIPFSLVVNPPQIMLPVLYSSCTAWMSPAYREGFGLTTLEAMACGVPVVTLRNFGLDEYLVHGENCMIVKTKKEAADALATIATTADSRNTLVKNGKALAAKFTWEKSVNQFHYALQEILK